MESGQHSHQLDHAKLDQLIDSIPLIADPVEKKRVALEVAVIAKNEYAHLPIVTRRTLVALGPRTGGLTPIPGLARLGSVLETITHSK